MSVVERYRTLYEYEKDCNQKMLKMIESVPEANRTDPRFQRIVSLAYHLAACRKSWLDHMDGSGANQIPQSDPNCELATLHPLFAEVEGLWTDYLSRLRDEDLQGDFSFSEEEETFSLPIEVQTVQLMGHAFYHRGQIVVLVDQLGGETVDTEYADWWWYANNQ